MEYRKFDDTYLIRLDLGDDVAECLLALCEEEHVLLGEISGIGAADHAVLGVYDFAAGAYLTREYNEFMEITSLLGSVTERDGKPYLHLHATTCTQDHAVHGGHVLSLRIGATGERFLRTVSGRVERRLDPKTGLNLFGF